MGVFERRHFLMSGGRIDEAPPEPQPPRKRSPRRTCRRGKGSLGSGPRSSKAGVRQGASAMAALMAARRQRLTLIAAKRASTSAWWVTQEQRTAALLQTLGVTWRPRLAHARVFTARRDAHRSVGASRATGSSLIAELHRNAAGRARPRRDSSRQRLQQPPPRALLYLLLRHSMLLEYAAAASRLLINRGLLQPALRREPELVDLPLGTADANGLAADGDEDHRAGRVRIPSRSANICSASRPPANPT